MLLDQIREKAGGGLDKLRLYSAVATKKDRTLDLCFAFPEKLTEEQEELIKDVCVRSVGGKFTVNVRFIKDYFDKDTLKSSALNYIRQEFLFFSSKIDENGILTEETEDGFLITVTVTPELRRMLEQNRFIERVSGHFASISNYIIKVRFDVIENPVDVDNLMKQTELLRETQMTKALYKPQRKIDVTDVTEYIGRGIKERPQYIIDVIQPEKSVTLCGKVESIKETVTPNGYVIFKFDLTDFTGTIGVIMFSDEKIYIKLKELCVGDEVLLNGQVKENSFTHELEMTAYRVCKCKIAADDYDSKISRPVPENYVVVRPEPYIKNAQESLFGGGGVCERLKGKKYVVFDLETTGKTYITDKIIEVGAVSVVDGNITETFSTFVNPERRIPREITELTGITDAMVENAPTFPEIIADFYKFCDGASLVAHNIEFDGGFLKFNTKDSGYIFNHPQLDTLAISRKYYRSLHGGEETPRNFKLGTLAEFLGVPRDNAHRAVDDSLMAADVFIKLVEMGAEL